MLHIYEGLSMASSALRHREACAAGGRSVAIMEHVDSSLLPCWETHLNDLSWVVADEVGTGCRP
jgi:hypothetical protein